MEKNCRKQSRQHASSKRKPKTAEQKRADAERAKSRRARIKNGQHTEGSTGGFNPNSPNRDKNQIAVCPHCSRVYHPKYGQESEYCCHNCLSESRWKPYEDCARCHASIGIGYRASGNVMGVNRAVIQRIRKRKGIKALLPSSTGWYRVKTEIHIEEERQKNLYIKYERAWMQEVRSAKKFPDWSQIWRNHVSSKSSIKAYRAMSLDERRDRNRRAKEAKEAKYGKDEVLKMKREQIRKWKEANPERHKQSRKIYFQSEAGKAAIRRHKSKPHIKARENMRKRFKDIMKTVRKNGGHKMRDLIGCSTKDLKTHLENQFKHWMTWENYGTKWHVDHIIPVAAFDHHDPKQVAQCWHFTNLQPLGVKPNLEKSDTITKPQLSLLF